MIQPNFLILHLNKSSKTTSIWGLIQFKPSVTFTDSTVYYWRIGVTPLSGPIIWNNSSFVYLANGSSGWNQSHLYQHFKSAFYHLRLDSTTRQLSFPVRAMLLVSNNGNYPASLEEGNDFYLSVDGATYIRNPCDSRRLNFVIINPATLFPEKNASTGSPGRFGSDNPCGTNTEYQFGFDYGTVAGRLTNYEIYGFDTFRILCDCKKMLHQTQQPFQHYICLCAGLGNGCKYLWPWHIFDGQIKKCGVCNY